MHIDIVKPNGFERITRRVMESSLEDAKKADLKRGMKHRKDRMSLDAECKARNIDQRGKRDLGYDLQMNKLAKSSFGNASEHLFKSSKPSLLRGALWGTAGVATGVASVIGGALGGGFRAIKGLTKLGS